MTPLNEAHRFGRVVIDENGIRQKPIFWFFGGPFDHSWSAIKSWSSVESVVLQVDTKKERKINTILELHAAGSVDYIIRKPGDTNYPQIVEKIRQYIPDLESDSLLGTLRQ